MLWVVLSLLAGVAFAAIALIGKQLLKEVEPGFFTSIYSLIGLIFYIPVFVFSFSPTYMEIIFSLTPLIVISGVSNAFGILIFNYGVQKTDVSIATPLSRLQPVFVAVAAIIVLNEALTLNLALGILLVTVGSYIVMIDNMKGLLEPLKSLSRDKGALAAILSAMIFTVAAITDRYVSQQLDPLVYTMTLILVVTVTTNGLTAVKEKNYSGKIRKELFRSKFMYITAGISFALSYFFILKALSLQDASQVIPLLQIQIPVTVIAGGSIYGEEHVVQKLVGSLVLVIGIILVVI